jgi:hypothetical protein
MAAATQEDTYTQAGIMAQIWVAFGQGSGLIRTSQAAVLALHTRYFDHIEQSGIIPVWGENAVQVLERIRTIGKVAAFRAMERSATIVSEADVIAAMDSVERESDTSWCPPNRA